MEPAHEMTLWNYIGKMLHKERDWKYVCELPDITVFGMLIILTSAEIPYRFESIRITRFKKPGEGYVGIDVPIPSNGPKPKYPRQFAHIRVHDDFSIRIDVAPGHQVEFNLNHQGLIEYLKFLNVKKESELW